jgi:hypothetical protein
MRSYLLRETSNRRLLDVNLAGLGRLELGQSQTEHSVVVFGLSLFGIHRKREPEGTANGAVAALFEQISKVRRGAGASTLDPPACVLGGHLGGNLSLQGEDVLS